MPQKKNRLDINITTVANNLKICDLIVVVPKYTPLSNKDSYLLAPKERQKRKKIKAKKKKN